MHTKIWSAIFTPFYDDGTVDYEGLRKNVQAFAERGIEGLFCNGLFGENWAVGAEERIDIARTVLDAADGRMEVCSVASVGTVEENIELGKEYKRMGLNYTCLITPSRKVPVPELISYFNRQMEAIDMPFVLFNSISPEGNVLAPQAFAEISKNPNVKILKTTASDDVNIELQRVAREGVMVANPHEKQFFKNVTENGQRIMFSDPEPYLYQSEDFRPIETYVRMLDNGDIINAKKVFDALYPLREVYDYWFLKPFYDGIMTMAYLKKFAEIAGLVGGNVRCPLKPVSPDEGVEMESQFNRAMREVREKFPYSSI